MLASYEGVYRMAPKFTLTIRASSGRLFVRGTGQPEFEMFPETRKIMRRERATYSKAE